MSVENISSQPALQNVETIRIGSKEPLSTYGIEDIKKGSDENPNKDQLEKVIKSINDFLESSSTHLQFKLHEELNEYYVTVVDNQTNEVVREIPSKKVLDVYAAMTEFIGLIVDKKI
ncbi:flagellar protein FlaG [Bacillus weihaiensis]|uniref:Flagellar biosynthesis protein FlaG n=1 Tax=Bacillus weihaiensis TaxID=1547283 RepID=A0A1L3MMM9_9BACI|nr:flagellar protein FlaG [Bacillus weihaiensis]APH03586.1 hypothetical protein A9C19_01795 [Bacillus weihaiensis]